MVFLLSIFPTIYFEPVFADGEIMNRLVRLQQESERGGAFAALRTEAQSRALRLALQVLGDLCGLGLNYFDFDNVGYVKTATEVSSDNSALMRNIRKNENAMQGAICGVSRALLACARTLGHKIPDEGDVGVLFDDSIVQDTTAEKKQDMAEVAAGLMETWEYRAKWYGESEEVARGAGLTR